MNAETIQSIANIYNGRVGLDDSPELKKELRKIILNAIAEALNGEYSVRLNPHAPYPSELIEVIEDLGFDIKLDGLRMF